MRTKIEYESTFEDWMTTHFFQLEQLSSLKKRLPAENRSSLVFYIGLGVFITLVSGPDALLYYAIIMVFMMIVLTHLQSRDFRQGLLFKRFRAFYEEIGEQQKASRIQWRITPDHLILDETVKENRIPWTSVERIVFCPSHVFVVFAGNEVVGLPRQFSPPHAFDSFVSSLTDTYRTAAEQQQRTAEIVESDWQINIAALQERGTWQYSVRKTAMAILYGVAFWVIGFAAMFLFYAGIVTVVSWVGSPPSRDGLFIRIISKATYLIAALGGLLGLMLGLYGKLPGTRTRR